MAVRWTNEQQRAIALDGNLLVAAAAGSGKTAVLTARIVRLIREGADMDRLLVVTFTNAAAAEMKKRIARELSRAAEEEKDKKAAARLREQALLSGRANISTIHSFCLYVLRRNFYDAGLDPAFRTAETAESAVLRQEAMEELFEARYADGSEVFMETLRCAGGEKELADWVETIYDFAMAQPEPFQWLDAALLHYHEPDAFMQEGGGLLAELMQTAREELEVSLAALEKAIPAVDAEKTKTQLYEETASVRKLLEVNGYDAFRAALNETVFKTLRFAKGEDGAVMERIKSLRNELKAAVAGQKKAFFHSLSEETALLRELAPAAAELFSMVKELHARYGEKKAERALVDFNDMEHMTLALLKDERIAAEYRARFLYIFVDEYQDSNRVQEAIISRVKRGDNLFLVGDVKQSIYRFRMAEPRLFMEKYDAYDGGAGTRVDLNANFRSAAEVIAFINSLFENVMSRELGEVDYDEAAKLHVGAARSPGRVECHLIGGRETAVKEELADEEREEALERETAALEAMLAASRIRELMKEDETLRYSDFAVLMRSVKTSAAVWVQELTLAGIPAYAELTGGYFDAVEVAAVLNLLRIIDNRRQDVPLMSVMRSPIGGFDAKELAELRIRNRDGSFFEAVRAAAERRADALDEKAADFFEKLARWRSEAGLVSVEEFIGRLLDETDFYCFVGALPGGAARQANLNALLSRARAFEQGASRSVSGFLRFMEKVKNSADFGAAPTGGMDVVRILSIHKSKGLEFPVVFLAGLGKRFNIQDKGSSIALDDEIGMGLRVRKNRRKMDTLFRQQITKRQWRRQLAEEMRLLYVGVTRAENRLILIGSASDLQKKAERYRHDMPPAQLAAAGCMLDWVIYALLQSSDGNRLREIFHLPLRGGEPAADVRVHYGSPAQTQDGGLSRRQYMDWSARMLKKERDETLPDLSWQYPYQDAVRTPSKASAAGGAGRKRSELRPLPAFLEPEKKLGAAGRGSAAHLVLQYIPFRAHTENSVRAFAGELRARGLMTEEQARAVPARRIAAFFASELGRRMIGAERIERELQFNLQLSASRLGCGPDTEKVMIQGVIDCCFMTEKGWVLLDYKTDRIPQDSDAVQTAEKHRRQVEIYAEALETLSGTPVCETHIFLLTPGIDVLLNPQKPAVLREISVD